MPDAFYRVSVKAIIVDTEGRLLLGFERGQRHYTAPGGGMDWGETPHETLRREIEEEMGNVIAWMAPCPIYILSHVVHQKRGLDFYFNLTIYYAVNLAGPIAKETVHYERMSWFTREELLNAEIFEGEEGIKTIYDPRDLPGRQG